MDHRNGIGAAFVLGAFLCAGLIGLGVVASDGVMQVKALERSVTVKGLAEREVPADVAIWPIRFNEVGNDLVALYEAIQGQNSLVIAFLEQHGFEDREISVSAPAITDRQAQTYPGAAELEYRYAGASTVTVYSRDVDRVRTTITRLVELGKRGVAIAGADYDARPQFLFTGLNDIKPEMIEAATRNARQVANKFAEDSDSRMGKIRRASQGQFSISDRDSNTPHIKKVRVVSTVEYYLSD
ncbi:MAG: SIMPL domain-containing protein [Gammaproteobacteria bacterium]